MTDLRFSPQAPAIGVARLHNRLPKSAGMIVAVIGGVLILIGGGGLITGVGHASLLLGLGLLIESLGLWLAFAVNTITPATLGTTNQLELLLPVELVPGYHTGMTALELWQLMRPSWQARFMSARFNLPVSLIELALTNYTPTESDLITAASQLSTTVGDNHLTVASLLVALITTSPNASALLTSAKLDTSELIEGIGWIKRFEDFLAARRPVYGGLARDWAAGFTPTLNQFATNMSKEVEAVGGRFIKHERTNQLDALIAGLSSATGSVVLVGEQGIGKTALLYGLADRLLRGDDAGVLRHHQIVNLSASSLLSRVQGTGDLERIILTILGEAVGAANIVVALDEAQLFFGQGVGAVNLSQMLLPVVQTRRLKLVLTLSPGDWQRLRSTNSALAGLLTPIVLSEPTEIDTLRLLADRALGLESGQTVISWQALKAAYRLSSRYDTDTANPGRSLRLLEASLNYTDGNFITGTSIERAIESQYGVKVQSAGAAETDILLHLEDHIHERMINQTRAVNVVASALRRARAGVANPRRPIGSFLFLGPTGVGKTELARSLAALYFGAEKAMIRLDMSEYQQPSDVARLLMSAADDPAAFLPRVKQQPFSVVLFDEIEKANPAILNLLLQLLDEGNLTDATNKPVSFKDTIIIATSNAGADDIRERIQAGQALETFEKEFTDKLISSGSFKPELLNRFDEIVLFRPLNEAELGQIVGIMVTEVNHTLQPQKVTVELTAAATIELVKAGYDPRLGARPMRRMVQRTVEDAVAGKILRGEAPAGTLIHLDVADLNLPQT